MSDARHFETLSQLLDLEAKAEEEQFEQRMKRHSSKDLEQRGEGLGSLVLRDEDSAAGDILLLTFSRGDQSQRLPWTRLRNGAPIVVSKDTGASKVEPLARGIVSKFRDTTIQIALRDVSEELFEHSKERFRIEPAPDDVSMRRQREALTAADSARGNRLAEIRDVLTGKAKPKYRDAPLKLDYSATLNEKQQQAVQFGLNSEHFGIIHGPPGTGKTTTVLELIRQAVKRGDRILACAPSHTAVDNLLKGLANEKFPVVRLGHPARVAEELREHSLNALVAKHEDAKHAKKLRREARDLRRKLGKWSRATPDRGERREQRWEAKQLVKEARRLERQAAQRVIDGARVLCSTLTGLNDRLLGERRFDLVVVDEACQSVEPACWIPMQRGDRVIFAGDHCQLPATIISQKAQRAGLGISLPERLIALYGRAVSVRLTVQYRMHEDIMEYPSLALYDGELEAAELVKSHTLAQLDAVKSGPLTDISVRFIDTAGAGFEEEDNDQSRLNRKEADWICKAVRELLATGLGAEDMAVIAPYSAQVRCLKELMRDLPKLEIDTVDGFQGREKEAVFISLVRSNVRGEIGFLSDIRRMNVAMTRARRKLLILGDSATIGGALFYKDMLDYFDSKEAYGTVWD
jgi:ATP-dependent RNA/DNA helicase IGHMBP2